MLLKVLYNSKIVFFVLVETQRPACMKISRIFIAFRGILISRSKEKI